MGAPLLFSVNPAYLFRGGLSRSCAPGPAVHQYFWMPTQLYFSAGGSAVRVQARCHSCLCEFSCAGEMTLSGFRTVLCSRAPLLFAMIPVYLSRGGVSRSCAPGPAVHQIFLDSDA